MFYILIKNWIVAIIGFIIFIIIIINPSFVTKYGIRTTTIDNMVRVFSIFLLLIWFIPHKSLFFDTVGYLKNGEKYLHKDMCTVKEIQKTVWFFFAQKSIICKNGKSYVDRFTSRFYHMGDKLDITYFPETTLIADTKTVEEKK